MSASEYRVAQRELVRGPKAGPWRLRLWLVWHLLAGHTLEAFERPDGIFVWRAHR